MLALKDILDILRFAEAMAFAIVQLKEEIFIGSLVLDLFRKFCRLILRDDKVLLSL